MKSSCMDYSGRISYVAESAKSAQFDPDHLIDQSVHVVNDYTVFISHFSGCENC